MMPLTSTFLSAASSVYFAINSLSSFSTVVTFAVLTICTTLFPLFFIYSSCYPLYNLYTGYCQSQVYKVKGVYSMDKEYMELAKELSEKYVKQQQMYSIKQFLFNNIFSILTLIVSIIALLK